MYSISTAYHLFKEKAATTNDELLYDWFLVFRGTYLCSTERQMANFIVCSHFVHEEVIYVIINWLVLLQKMVFITSGMLLLPHLTHQHSPPHRF